MRVILRHVGESYRLRDVTAPWEKRYPVWFVSFDSDYGSGQGQWMGRGSFPDETVPIGAPPLDTSLDVELDCDCFLEWGNTLTVTERIFPAITQNGKEMLLRGILEGNASKFTTVRIGESLMIVKACGVPPPLGSVIEMRITRLLLYPYSL